MTIYSSIKQGYGKKKLKRLALGGSEKNLFQKIYEKVGGKCQLTGHYVPGIYSCSFAHILGKGMYPEYRLNPNNIIFVANLNLHHWVDKAVNGRKAEVMERVDQGIAIEKLKQMRLAENCS